MYGYKNKPAFVVNEICDILNITNNGDKIRNIK